MWSQRLQSEREGRVGAPGAEMELKLASTVSRTGAASSERFRFQEKTKSECQVELLLV